MSHRGDTAARRSSKLKPANMGPVGHMERHRPVKWSMSDVTARALLGSLPKGHLRNRAGKYPGAGWEVNGAYREI
jgi:hypothetical protein